MNLKTLIMIFALVTVVAVAGCTQKQTQQQVPADLLQKLQQQKEAAQTPVQQPAVTPPAVEEKPQCTTNVGCDDKDPCTTDTCSGGVCKHTPEGDCLTKTEVKPKITDANFGVREQEYVLIEGKNWLMDDWEIQNSKGETLMKFFKKNDLTNQINGKWKVYTKCDLSVSGEKYACKDKEFFADTGDKAVLKDETGAVVSQYPQ